MKPLPRLLLVAALACAALASPSVAGRFGLFSRNRCCQPCPPCPPCPAPAPAPTAAPAGVDGPKPGAPPAAGALTQAAPRSSQPAAHVPISADSKPLRHGRVHALLIAATDDPSIGRAVKLDNQHMKEALTHGLPAWGRGTVRTLESSMVLRHNIFNEIDRLPVGPDDTLFVYFTGHGGYDRSGQHVIALARGRLSRKELLARIKARRARLTVLMTDACSGEAPVEEGNHNKAPVRNGLLVSLLLEHAGVVDVNAATQGQLGWCSSTGVGSWFTWVFVQMCRDQPWRDPRHVTWQEAWAYVVRETVAFYKMRKQQILSSPTVDPRVRQALEKQAEQRPQAYELTARRLAISH